MIVDRLQHYWSELRRRVDARLGMRGRAAGDEYRARMQREIEFYKDVVDVNALPAIFVYWSNKYVRPMLEEFGVSNPEQLFAKYLGESAKTCGDSAPVFVSIGAGNCDTEVRVAQLMRAAGMRSFVNIQKFVGSLLHSRSSTR